MAYFCVIWHCTADDSRCCSSSSVVRDIRRRCQLWFFWLARPLDIYAVKGEVYVARRRGHCSYLTRLVGFGNNNEDDITAPSQQKSSWFQQTAKNQGGRPVTPQADQLRLGPGLRFLHPQSPAPFAKLASSKRPWMAACNCRSDEKRWARRRASGLTTHCGAVLGASPPTPHSLLACHSSGLRQQHSSNYAGWAAAASGIPRCSVCDQHRSACKMPACTWSVDEAEAEASSELFSGVFNIIIVGSPFQGSAQKLV